MASASLSLLAKSHAEHLLPFHRRLDTADNLESSVGSGDTVVITRLAEIAPDSERYALF